jgi:integrase
MDARNEPAQESMAPAAMVEQLLTEIAPATTPDRQHLPGLGTIYRRGRVWWIKWSTDGKRRRESSKSERDADAIKLLRRRIDEAARDRRRDPVAENRVTMTQLFDALEADYTANGRRSSATLVFRLAPLRDAFGQDKARAVTAARIARYAKDRRDAGREPATVNRELAALRRAFTITVEQERLSVAPRVKLFAEHNARQGFLERVDFDAVVWRLPGYLQDFARFAYGSGWRKGEVATLEWPAIDKDNARATLRREHSKNGEPRVLPLVGELAQIIARRRRERAYTTLAGETAESRFVFHRHGDPVGDFRKAWAAACIAAGFAKPKVRRDGRPVLDRRGQPVMKATLIFHDLRRSAVRNLVAAGVDQAVAMRVTGHQTISVFQRYRIVSDDDVRAALERTQAALAHAVEGTVPAGQGHNPGHNQAVVIHSRSLSR